MTQTPEQIAAGSCGLSADPRGTSLMMGFSPATPPHHPGEPT